MFFFMPHAKAWGYKSFISSVVHLLLSILRFVRAKALRYYIFFMPHAKAWGYKSLFSLLL